MGGVKTPLFGWYLYGKNLKCGVDVGQILCKIMRWESGGGYFCIFSRKSGFCSTHFFVLVVRCLKISIRERVTLIHLLFVMKRIKNKSNLINNLFAEHITKKGR